MTVQAGVDITVREGLLNNLSVSLGAGFAFNLSAQHRLVATWLREEVLFGAHPAGCYYRFEGVFDAQVKVIQFSI